MFIPLNLNEAKEAKPVPIGKYPLTILDCEITETKAQKKPQYIVSIGIGGHDDAPPVRHYVGIPTESDTADAMRFKVLLLKRFISLFNVPANNDGFDVEGLAMQMRGATATAELLLDREKDADGREKPDGRVFNRLVVPQLKDEGQPSAPKPPKR